MYNKVTLIGNIGADAEGKTTHTGVHVTSFRIATTESHKDTSGEWQNVTQWHNIVTWRELAERCAGLLKGERVLCEGKITYREYTDKDGVKRTVTDIVCDTVRRLDKKPEAATTTATPAPQTAPTNPNPSANDLPF